MDALASVRLRPPFTSLGVQRYCNAAGAPAAAAERRRLADDGLEPRQLAHLLVTLAEDRARESPRGSDSVDLVWTGPEPPGAASRDTAVVVRELFASAGTEVLVAAYAVVPRRLRQTHLVSGCR